MSRRIQIQTLNFNLDFTINTILVFTGGNVDTKREILNTLMQTASKYIDENQGNLIDQSGKVLFDGVEVSNRNTDIIYLDQYYSLYKELILKKSYYLFDEVIEISNQIQMTTQIERINDEFSKFEFIINQSLNELYPELSLNFPYFSQDALIKKFASLTLDREMITSEKMIETFIKLISNTIKQNGNRIWIILDGIDRHLSIENFKYLFNSLEEVAKNTQRLNIFLFNIDHSLKYLSVALEDCILIYNDIQQLSPINEIHKSIERHYPDTMEVDETLLQYQLFSVLPYIGFTENISLNSKDMVVLKVLKKLLGDNTKNETSFESLSSLEKLFLEDQVL